VNIEIIIDKQFIFENDIQKIFKSFYDSGYSLKNWRRSFSKTKKEIWLWREQCTCIDCFGDDSFESSH